ncbi:flavo protein oxygenase [Nadsonia fulvescens var. elongata DSM 6958]|uniref:Flavo protein oxygenase n=1 Tax=Nadsonia fulvescens var. elongata DSM 6958 TaxID=857566 RepID=A0A1E3PV12_9ASCO|nr:flavo protein oxygenase [Nadsonia fulvescens var. elongata DSM 6958]
MSGNTSNSGLESQAKRDPHGDFKAVESSRPKFDQEATWKYTKNIDPGWKPGSGANNASWKDHRKVEVDPYGEGRSHVDNYKLLISGITPRFIGFISTVSKDGTTRNLAPFSYTTVVNHDPPIFCIGFSGGKGSHKDTCKNLLETGELTINVISEWFIEAANYTCTNAPYGVDEWKLSGLTPIVSKKVRPAHVAESAFSIEAKLIHSHEWTSKTDPTRATGTLCIVEGVNFHVREDIANDKLNMLDISALKPVGRLGGITYSRTMQGFEMTRPVYDEDKVKEILN